MADSDAQNVKDLMDRAASYGTIGKIAEVGVGAFVLGFIESITMGTQQIFEFLFLPFDLLIDVADTSVTATLIEPWNIVTGGGPVEVGAIEQTAIALAGRFDILSLPVAEAIVLGSIGLVLVFLAASFTSNFAPGIGIDNPLLGWFFTTSEEEAEDE